MGCGASTAAVAPADVVPPQPDAATDGASPLKKANTVPSTLGVNSPIGAPGSVRLIDPRATAQPRLLPASPLTYLLPHYYFTGT